MVPARLKLRNFLCYRDSPPLELEHVRIACLSGENGNGKSALLDAMTWALWGRARGRDGDLISLGQTEMEVELEFFLGEARHRVIRKCQRTGARGGTHTTLEFHLWDGEKWRVLSGSTQSETQRTLVDTLRLSYDTFVNSAFLMQGRADAFTVKSPGERKQVLAEILNLAQYDLYEERAKERRNERARLVEQLDRQVHDAEVALAKLPERRAERDTIQAELDQHEADLKDAAAIRDLLQAQATEAARLREEQQQAEQARDRAAAEQAQAETRAAARRAEQERYAAVAEQAEPVRAGHARLLAVRETLQRLSTETDALVRQAADAERARDDAAAELAQAERRAAAHRAEIDRCGALVAGADTIRAGYARLIAARAVLAEQDRRRARVDELDRIRRPLAEAVIRAEHGLRADLAVRQSEAARLAEQAERVDILTRARVEADGEQVSIDTLEKRLAAVRDEEADLRGEVQSLKSENGRLRAEMDGLKVKFDALKAAVEHGDADCPLCRSNLGHDGLRRIEESYQRDGREKAALYRDNQKRIQDREAAAQARAEEARRLEADLTRRRDAWKSRTAVLDRELSQAREAAARLATVRAEADRWQQALAAGDFARAEREQVAILDDEIAAAGYDEAAHARARGDMAELEPFDTHHQSLVRAEADLASARARLGDEEQILMSRRTRHDEAVARIAGLQSRLAALPLEHARQEAEGLAAFEVRYEELQDAEARLPLVCDALAVEERSAGEWRSRRDEAADRLARLQARLGELADAETKLGPARVRAEDLVRRCGEVRRALGGIEQQIDDLETLERETDGRRRRLAEAQREHALYEELVRAFGKQGAQALIIDSALPEIEAAANELLARMTNNRMHVTLDTQRQTQKGTVQETLEIKIADEWGTRSYEMYSGGEAFRINLALRIALSKLLARRAGAPLPTLVIDEGFGTQDAAGRERLVEAITAIQDEFQCLLLVTHIDELKDLFDTRIEVVKTGDGSVARVVAA